MVILPEISSNEREINIIGASYYLQESPHLFGSLTYQGQLVILYLLPEGWTSSIIIVYIIMKQGYPLTKLFSSTEKKNSLLHGEGMFATSPITQLGEYSTLPTDPQIIDLIDKAG